MDDAATQRECQCAPAVRRASADRGKSGACAGIPIRLARNRAPGQDSSRAGMVDRARSLADGRFHARFRARQKCFKTNYLSLVAEIRASGANRLAWAMARDLLKGAA